MTRLSKNVRVLPGFGLTLGYTLLYLTLIVLIPLSSLFLKLSASSWSKIWSTVFDPRVVASYKLTFGASFVGALINLIFGFIVAWCLVRYRLPGKRILDALVDLPFALPTAVSGIALTTIYGPSGVVGSLAAKYGIKTASSPLGITIALTFIGLPFVVRTLQPALEELDAEAEDAAAILGASRWQTFWRIIVPSVMPAAITGFALAFARALGEYGSVVFIAGNLPMKTEITSFLIITKLEQYDVPGAAAIAVMTLLCSFLILLAINLTQWWAARYSGRSV